MSVYDLIAAERARQDDKWGQQDHPDANGGFSHGLSANYAQMVNDMRAKKGQLAWDWILLEEVAEALEATSREHLIEELTQVAAVCVAQIEAIQRRESANVE